MNRLDILLMALENLWRMKLRAFLTILGVIIGVAALVGMLSFGFGVQKNVADSFKKLDLFETIRVLPANQPEKDSTEVIYLDRDAVEKFKAIKGVKMAYGEDSFPAEVTLDDHTEKVQVQMLPFDLVSNKNYFTYKEGSPFESDSSFECVLRERFLDELLTDSSQSIINQKIRVKTTGKADILSAFLSSRLNAGENTISEFQARIVEFILSVMSPAEKTELFLTVSGVVEPDQNVKYRMKDVMIPLGLDSRIERLGFTDPSDLLAAVSEKKRNDYPAVRVQLTYEAYHDTVKAQIEAMGFVVFSFSEEFDEIRQSFIIFDLILGLIGIMALSVASLGIMNTMMMSVSERKREIGILLSLGSDSNVIRLLFLAESAMIGLVGSIIGFFAGWGASRIMSMIASNVAEGQGGPPIDMFTMTPLLAGCAIAFGVLVSIIAGLLPANRAATIDPVRALRNE